MVTELFGRKPLGLPGGEISLYRLWCPLKGGRILLGDFSELTNAKLTIQGFSNTRYNLIQDTYEFLKAKSFQDLTKSCTVEIEERRY